MTSYGERIRQAHKKWELEHDAELPWAQVARLCQKLLGKPVDPSTMIRWKSGKQEPTIAEFRALGQVLEADPGLLAFGTQAGRVEIPMEPEQPLPVELQKPATKRRRGTG